MEPFLTVRGRLQKDGATLNVIAHSVEALRVPGAPVRRSGLARTYAEARARHEAPAMVRESPDPGAFRYLTALRQSPPGIKSFG
jgi:hypothetical protein